MRNEGRMKGLMDVLIKVGQVINNKYDTDGDLSLVVVEENRGRGNRERRVHYKLLSTLSIPFLFVSR